MPRPRPALDVTLLRPDRTTTATLDALLDDYRPFAIDERPPATRRVFFFTGESRDAAAAALARTLGAGVDVEAIDLDPIEGIEDAERLPELLAGKRMVKGGAVESDAGVAAALAADVETIVARHPLPVMLAAIQAAAKTQT